MSFVADFDPPALWGHFDHILAIPRGSRNEEGMRRYVGEIAARRGCALRRDAAGNVVVAKPASPGGEGAATPVAGATTVLQSHLDMVNEKNTGVAHDFARDPIRPRSDGEYLKAEGTTLGADNGIGVAAMLAILESADLTHGPLELLFTVEEEVGLLGAQALDPSLVTGRRLLNLDSEEEGTVTVGCAGAAGSDVALPLAAAAVVAEGAVEGASALAVRLAGLKGGHSGLEIHLGRGNAVKLLARALAAARETRPFRLAAFNGGDKRNAIAREAAAVLVLSGRDTGAVTEALEHELAAIAAELRKVEPDLGWDIVATAAPAQAWTAEATERALALVEALPHGVLAMSHDIPGLVETSTNLASAAGREGVLRLHAASRSSVASALAATRRRIRAVAALAGAGIEESPGYPAWQPDLESPLLALTRRVHARVAGAEPTVQAIHAGLECGLLGEKLAGMDMVSIGPQIESPHSPDERVHVTSVARFYRLLTALLEELAAV